MVLDNTLTLFESSFPLFEIEISLLFASIVIGKDDAYFRALSIRFLKLLINNINQLLS